MTTTNTTTNPTEVYKAARSEGKDTAAACRAVLIACKGIDFDDVCDMSWLIETGKRAPRFQNEDGTPTAAALAWDRGTDNNEE